MDSVAERRWWSQWRLESRRWAERLIDERAECGGWRELLRERFRPDCIDGLDTAAVTDTVLCLSLLFHCARMWRDAAADDPLAPQLEAAMRDPSMERLASLLTECPSEALFVTLQQKSCGGDPLEFLVEASAEMVAGRRKQLGIFFTPAPIIEFLVRNANRLATDRSSSNRTVVIDPACGAGSFLSKQLDHITPERPHRLIGYEVLPASWAAAQVLLQRKLRQVSPAQTELEIRLASSLTVHSLSAEGVEPDTRLLVIGNPPYANFGRRNRDPWIVDLLDDYKQGLNERKQNLNDDFVKFIRWAQYQIEQHGSGILAFITSNTYLRGLTHRRMRASLRETFDELYVWDLHGSVAKGGSSPGGGVDENVFGIRQGVALAMFQRTAEKTSGTGSLRCAELWGTRAEKLRSIQHAQIGQIEWRKLPDDSDHPFALHQSSKSSWMRLDDVFGEYSSGVQSKRDALFVDKDRATLADRIRSLFSPKGAQSREELPAWLRRKLESSTFRDDCIQPYQTAPFDRRWIYYDPTVLGRSRYSVMRHLMQADNVALVFMRQSTNPGEYDHFMVTETLVSDRVFYSAHGAPFLAPLYLHEDGSRQVNLSSEFLRQVAAHVGEPVHIDGGRGHEPQSGFDERDVFGYLYALFHSSAYRREFAGELNVDFPPAPPPSNRQAFLELSRLGKELAGLHLQPNRVAPAPMLGQGTDTIDRVVIEPSRLSLNADQHFRVASEIAEWKVGGYRVIRRWLKSRKGQTLSTQEKAYIGTLLTIAKRTRSLVRRIDALPSPYWTDDETPRVIAVDEQ